MNDKVTSTDMGLMVIRAALAIVFVYHGAQKLFGWFGGYGIEGTAGFFESIGIPLPVAAVVLTGFVEFFGGLALGLGLAVRPAAAALFGTMMVASFTAHTGFNAATGGMELPFTLGLIALGLTATGAGALSVLSLPGLVRQPETRTASQPA